MNDEYANGDGMHGKEPGGYCIEIYVGADNQVKAVKVEQKAMQGDAEMEVEAKMPVASIDEAIQAAQAIYEAQGKLDPQMMQGAMAARAEAQENDEMMEGYGRGNIRGNGRMPVGKVFAPGDA